MQTPARQSLLTRRLLRAGLSLMLLLIFIWVRGEGLRAEVPGLARAEGILAPRFTAAYNEWFLKHPTEPDHYSKIDAKDRQRWEAVREAFRVLDREMKNAGY